MTVGGRSGCFVVSLPSVGITTQLVNADQPHAVVDLILAALPKVSESDVVEESDGTLGARRIW
ncbi:hypothetical protein GCM10022252_28680 [Streptosporangium oxazolinicum]|uniref:Uncharacterized protein n=1 Tax=Streptosporangium oxazolinicum TaxID=909287 RepID=A0ABP8ATV1_9ACTN